MQISLSAVGLSFGRGNLALNDLSLDIKAGERLAIIGPSGAGKTSLLRIIGTALRPSSGRFNLDGAEPWSLGGARLRELRGRIGTVHQAPPLPPRQRLVTAVLAGRLGRWGVMRSLASLVYPADIEGARAALARVGMDDRLFDRCDQLSGGQLQRVGVARVLYQQPDLLLADEPVSALDPELAHRTIGELNNDAGERGATLVASLHAVDLALGWFPRIVGVRDGAIQFDLPPDQVSMPMLSELYRSEIEPSAGCDQDLSALTCRTLAVSRPSFCR